MTSTMVRLLWLICLFMTSFFVSVRSFSPQSLPRMDAKKQFPTTETSPAEVLEAQLEALQDGDMETTYHLFSRARRFFIDDAARRDVREQRPGPERVFETIRTQLNQECPGLIEHQLHKVLAVVEDPSLPKGRLPTRTCRVRVDTKYFIFTLTRQSGFDGGDPRDNDVYGRCWFVWTIRPEDKRGRNRESPKQPAPSGLELPVAA